MAKCALCEATFPSKQKLVHHFSEAHSVAKQRSRRSKVTDTIKRIVAETDDNENDMSVLEDDSQFIASPRQPLPCQECGEQFATRASLQTHQCSSQKEENFTKKQPVLCQFCGQKCKDRRGAAIHQAFCERKNGNITTTQQEQVVEVVQTFFECSGEDCGAIFKTQGQLAKHMQKHHGGETITLVTNASSPRTTVSSSSPRSEPPPLTPQPNQVQQPLVTVTMKPHIGKTDGLQDLSLLITPTKGMEESAFECGNITRSYPSEKDSHAPTITVEECRAFDNGISGGGEAVLYLSEDGTLLETLQNDYKSDNNELHKIIDDKNAFLIFSDDEVKKTKLEDQHECSFCDLVFTEKKNLSVHISKSHKPENVIIKKEPLDEGEEEEEEEDENEEDPGNSTNDEDWELVSVGKRKKLNVDFKIKKRKYEYRCKLCRRNFLSELGYQVHVRNKECKNKKFKLTRMFSCHFKRCDSSFFKLTELQRHWQIAHKYSMASKNLVFDDERAFTQWLADEEEKDKVRFTCDVRRRKPHRTERLLVCHRFHHLRTAAARKAANQEYSDKHNWIHKIQPCLCFARMKVYQEFDKDTCDYTGKIKVIYYYEHSHPDTNEQEEKAEIIDHILQRNKRNRPTQFQDLKGNDKLMHRQKLEKFARIAGKEYRNTIKSPKALHSLRKFKHEPDDFTAINAYEEDQIAADNVANNLLGSDELFATQVEMVLDGQFDMGPEVLAGPVVSHLGGLAVFEGNRVENMKDDSMREQDDDTEVEEEASTLQVVLPASTDDWGKLFDMVRARVAGDVCDAVKAEAALVLPYEKVIELIPPNEQIPIFRQLWELAYPANQSEEEIEFELRTW